MAFDPKKILFSYAFAWHFVNSKDCDPNDFGLSNSLLGWFQKGNDGWGKITHHIVVGLAVATGLHLTAK